MNRTRFFCLFLLPLVLGVTGCSGFKPSIQGEKLRSALSMAETYRIRAKAAEAEDNPAQALYFYRIAQKIDPANTDVLQKITALRTKINKKSDLHFKRGVSFYRRSMQNRAQKEFLTALRINPSHGEAKEYLLKKMGVKTTGNAVDNGSMSNIMPAYWQMVVSPGRSDWNDMLASIDKGLYIANTWYTRYQDTGAVITPPYPETESSMWRAER